MTSSKRHRLLRTAPLACTTSAAGRLTLAKCWSLSVLSVGYSAAMPDSAFTTSYGREQTGARAISTTQLLGQVLFLVAIALGFCALGTYLGRDLEIGTARIILFVGFGMLRALSFGGTRFRVGLFAMAWLFATATAIGLGLGPVIEVLRDGARQTR